MNARNLAELPSRTEDAFTLTQVRATAQLLTFCGLLHEAYPLGRYNAWRPAGDAAGPAARPGHAAER